MKTTTASLFLLFIFSITQSSFLFGVANAAGDAVLDRDGDEVLTGVPYYIVSLIWGAGGGGLAIGRESDRKCPEIVVQRLRHIDYGSPMIFSNADSSDGVVRVSSDVRVKFVGPRDRLCLTSTVWKVQDKDESTGNTWVELGGSEGEPGCDTMKNWFKLETGFTKGTYKFKYCPSVCSSSVTSCNEIERAQDTDGQMRLALSGGTGYPWSWVFIKADKANARIRQVFHA
ncbi:ARABIDOPSIS THALIANA KUNITZ TRYPSIN INHIBITOR 5 [Hibiscus trionum]|uniref:ARABIDOPSIS THALIANA KUNITZ TRYPSIN INHIBITOR 5 n=1 Tax=Hibiscus trionum TaxID=183268 RepID=A0A9W7JGB9_HIBTR|nr:ARABIDOPSIS THALIANA KUNITZ TRYPSIN INHIBITOR 5 [Hibiscus trionum]GMJ12284.1 ARABIDOPSIS THALIANA KUNITZ TRYPSIN INHIBITOR 5 [Hibiscus trionum]